MRFIERVSYAFDRPYLGELFSYGRLFERSGAATQLALGPGTIVRPRPGGSNGVANIDVVGRVRGSSGEIKCFVIGGAVIDSAGDTLAVVEMADSIACPSDYLPDYGTATASEVLAPWNEATPDLGGPDVPPPTGKWSLGMLEAAVA